MNELGDEIEDEIEKVHRAVGLEITKDVILNTPVDTGRARSNWHTNLVKPDRSTREPFSKGENLGIGESQNSGAAIAEGFSRIGLHRKGQDIFITNNLNYIQFLNDGSSDQAPRLFVERAIQRGEGLIKRFKL